MPKIDEAYVEIGTKMQKLTQGLRKAQVHSERWARSLGARMTRLASRGVASFGRMLSSVTRKMKLLGGALIGAIVAVEVKALKTAMGSKEIENLFKVSMGKRAKEASAWVGRYAKQLKLFAPDVKRMVGLFNVMLKSSNMNEKAAYRMAKSMTQLTHDFSSFYDLAPDEVFQKMQAFISGEYEPMRRLGFAINQTQIKAEALSRSLIRPGQDLERAKSIELGYQMLLRQSIDAQGDLVRTLGSEANVLRSVRASWLTFLQKLGKESMAGGGFNRFLVSIREMINEFGNATKPIGKAWNELFSFLGKEIWIIDEQLRLVIERMKKGAVETEHALRRIAQTIYPDIELGGVSLLPQLPFPTGESGKLRQEADIAMADARIRRAQRKLREANAGYEQMIAKNIPKTTGGPPPGSPGWYRAMGLTPPITPLLTAQSVTPQVTRAELSAAHRARAGYSAAVEGARDRYLKEIAENTGIAARGGAKY